MEALRADGCALIPATIPPATAAELAALLTTYTPGTAGTAGSAECVLHVAQAKPR